MKDRQREFLCMIYTVFLLLHSTLSSSTTYISPTVDGSGLRNAGSTVNSGTLPGNSNKSVSLNRLVDLAAPVDRITRFAPKSWRRIRVSADKRHFEYEDGSPFFYLGDTAWELFHRLNREEADLYLENRASKGFTVIQAVALAELDGLNTPNAYGHKPLHNNNPATPNDAYFQHVDYIVNKAESLGMYVGMLPTWGDKFLRLAHGVGPEVFTPDNARAFGSWIGNRYKDKPVIWILGGDRMPENSTHLAIIRAMAEGIRSAIGNGQLITYHPAGPSMRGTTDIDRGSSTYFHNDSWLDFNMFQSGHSAYDVAAYKWVGHDRSLNPAKPVLDAESRYEDHPVDWNPVHGWFNDYDVRQGAYWAVMAGAAGHTYGDHNIWQMWQPGRNGISAARTPWKQALDHQGAWHMGHMKDLFLSRPWLDLNPDQSLIASGQGNGESYVTAAKGKDYAMYYIPTGNNLTVNLGKFSGNTVKGWWFNPRNKEVTEIGTFPNSGTKAFDAPGANGRGNDWVLVLDDESKHYPAPGHGEVIVSLPPANQAPAVSITAPGNNSSFAAGSTINLQVNASDNDGAVTRVEFFAGQTRIGESSQSPFSFQWKDVPQGSHSLTAKATDNHGATATSAGVSVQINGTTPPPAQEDEKNFYRAINLNGSAVTIDGNRWDGSNAANYSYSGLSFTDNSVALKPATDASRTAMIRSSVYANGSLRVSLTSVPSANYEVYLYVWEDNDAETFSISLEGKVVKANHNSGAAGTWTKLGPYPVSVEDGNIELTTTGGHANISGIEVWGTGNSTEPANPNPPVVSPGTDPNPLFSGYYKLIAKHSGKALDVQLASSASGANVEQWEYYGGVNQIWHVISTGDGYYKLIAKHSGKALDVTLSGTANGVNIQQWVDNGTDAQKWKIEPVGDGYYKLTAKCSSKALEVYDGLKTNGANIIQWQYVGIDHQKWKLESVSGNGSDAAAGRVVVIPSVVKVHPNPAASVVTLNFEWQTNEDVRIVITNATGVEFHNTVKTVASGENTADINVNHLPVGIYFINIGNQVSEKLIISR